MTSAFVCASLGIVPTVRHADYIGSWLAVLREDDRASVRAASAASKAAEYLLAFRPESNGSVEAVASSDALIAGELGEMPAKGAAPSRFEDGHCRHDGSPATESVGSARRGDKTMRMPDYLATRGYDHDSAGILRSKGNTFCLDQRILLTASDTLGHDAREEAISRTCQNLNSIPQVASVANRAA